MSVFRTAKRLIPGDALKCRKGLLIMKRNEFRFAASCSFALTTLFDMQ